MLGLGATKLPAWVWGWLPPSAALALRTAARSYTESRLLPVIAVGGISGASPLLSRSSHRSKAGHVGSPGLGPGGNIGGGNIGSNIGGNGGSADSLDSPKLHRGYNSPRRPSGQLQTAVAGGLSSLGRTAEPAGLLHMPPSAQPAAAAPAAIAH